jgi:hypothetical protein
MQKSGGPKAGAWCIAAMVAGLLALYWGYLPRRAPQETFYTGDQGVRLMQVEGMKRYGFALFHNPNPRIDPNAELFRDRFLSRLEGRPMWVVPPFFASISLPSYAALGVFGLYVLPAVGAIVCVLALWRAGAVATGRWYAGLAAAACFGLASPAVFYGAEFSEHSLAAALSVGGVCCYVAARGRTWAAVSCGALCGAAGWLREESTLILPAVAVLMCTTSPGRVVRRDLVAFGLAALAILAPLVALNTAWFGTPLGLHAMANVARGGVLGSESVLGRLREVLLPPQWYQVAAIGAAIACRALWGTAGRKGRGEAWCWAYAGALVCVAAAVVLPRVADKALLVVAPWVLCLLGAAGTSKYQARCGEGVAARNGLAVGLAAAATIYVIGVLFVAPNTGGALWGPRYLLPGVGLLALAGGLSAASALERTRGNARAAIAVAFVALFLAGGYNATRSIGSLCSIKHQNAMMLSHLVKHTEKGDVIVSDTWWLAQVSAILVYERHFFIITEGPEAEELMDGLMERLRELGVSQVHYVTETGGPNALRTRIEAEGKSVRSIPLVPYRHRMGTYVLDGT